MTNAFGQPGISGTWTSSAKDLVTTAALGASRVWLTMGHGIGNEIYWPSTGRPQVRDFGFLVRANGEWIELKRAANYTLTTPAPGVLAPTVVHHGDGWDITFRWVVDHRRDVVLVDYTVEGAIDGLYALIAPHLGSGERTNSAWVDGDLYATADDDNIALCVSSEPSFVRRSVGYVGSSDGWQDLHTNGEMQWEFDAAPHGNVALTAELARPAGTVAIGFASSASGARILARSSLTDGFATAQRRFIAGWQRVANASETVAVDPRWQSLVEHSASVLACHEDRSFPGATVASLSIPWGNDRSDLGGYHLVWSRDCVEVAFANVALGHFAAAERTLSWLCAAQQADGHWSQNAYPDGRAFWTGVQLDEVAFPILLAVALDNDNTPHTVGASGAPAAANPIRDMVRRAAGYLVAHGPASPQDRWEENAGTNAFTLAAVVAALFASLPWLEDDQAAYARSLAHYWNERIEDWLYAEHGPLCEGRGIDGYYVRIGESAPHFDACGRVDVRNRIDAPTTADRLVACDFLALVRFGLRRADDPRIVNTVTLIDDLLAVHLPTGVAYRRYNGDGYGEHDDGTPFNGTGVGRPWPLLAGERGHYACQAGESPDEYLASMAAMCGAGQLLPEQVWDAAPIPRRFLEPGHPTGSAMPLAWAHAEFIKLATYAARGRPVELLSTVTEQLATNHDRAWHWRVDLPFDTVPANRDVIIDHHEPFVLCIGDDDRTASTPCGFGRHLVRVAPGELGDGFALRNPDLSDSPVAQSASVRIGEPLDV